MQDQIYFPEYEGHLLEKYPEIYSLTEVQTKQQIDGKYLKKTCVYCGVNCPKGWYSIVDKLSENLCLLSKDQSWRIVVSQIKEKFGGLRFYYDIKSKSGEFYYEYDNLLPSVDVLDQIESLVKAAESESFKTCEACGEPGLIISDNNWVYTRCEKH